MSVYSVVQIIISVVVNASLNNISAIPVILGEETEEPGENHQPAACHYV
jgi:hypothetical protein